MIISRYLTREVVQLTVVVTLVLLLAFLSQQLVRYLNYVAVGKIATNLLLQLISFEVPFLVSLLLPLGLYLGMMLTFSRLYSDNEMLILQMAGYGTRRLVRLTLMLGLCLGGFVLMLMLWINPLVSAKRQVVMQSDEATTHLVQTMIPGRFQATLDGRQVMYVGSLSMDRQRAQNVFVAQENIDSGQSGAGQKSWMIVFANQGYQMRDKESHELYFVTTDGYRYEGMPGQNDYKIIKFKKYAVRIPQTDMRVTHQESEGMTTAALWKTYRNPSHAAELQWRVSVAIAMLILALTAIPLSFVRPRQGRFVMLVPAIIIYVVYMNLMFVARRWVEDGSVSVTIGMWWVHLLMFALLATLFYVRYRSARKAGKT